MSERAARRGRRVRLSRRGILGASIVALAACLVAFVFLFRPRPRPAAAGQRVSVSATVTVAETEIKREPRAGSATIAKVSRGARVEVRRDDGFWIEVLTSGSSGYLPVDTVERDTEREARERRAGTILSFPPVSGVVAEDTDLRLSPFPMGPRAGRLQKGTVVKVYSVDQAFYALRGPDGGLAFVESGKVDVVPPDPAKPEIVPARERALKDLQVMEVAEPLPEAPGEEVLPVEIPETPRMRRGPSGAPAGPSEAVSLEPATLSSKVDPVYPDIARRAGVEGTVVLSATIGVDGRVTDVQVVRGLGFGLSEAAVAAVRRWQYRPAQGPEGPIVSRKEVRIEFRLRP